MSHIIKIYIPTYTEVICPSVDDEIVPARDGFCSVCGKTDHEVLPDDAA